MAYTEEMLTRMTTSDLELLLQRQESMYEQSPQAKLARSIRAEFLGGNVDFSKYYRALQVAHSQWQKDVGPIYRKLFSRMKRAEEEAAQEALEAAEG